MTHPKERTINYSSSMESNIRNTLCPCSWMRHHLLSCKLVSYDTAESAHLQTDIFPERCFGISFPESSSQTLRLCLVPEKLKGKENAKENNFFMFGFTAEKKSNIIKIS